MSIELVMLSSHFILCCPLLLLPSIFPSIWFFSNELALPIMTIAKVLELQLQHESFQWIFKVDFLWDLLVWSPCCKDSQESSPAPHFESTLQYSALFMVQLSCPYMNTGKIIALTIWTFVSNLVITFKKWEKICCIFVLNIEISQ